MTILLLSGARDRDDPWHDFEATSAAVADTLRGAGWDVAVRDAAAVDAHEYAAMEALVVNCGQQSPPGTDSAATAAFVELLASARPVLALHTSANSFADLPQWADRIGVRWVAGRSMHPPIGQFAVVGTRGHPIGAGLGVVDVFDERYSHLEVTRPGVTVLAHRLDGLDHPLCLARQDSDGRRTVYDALGHDVESYRSDPRRELLRREMSWLLGSGDPDPSDPSRAGW